MHQKKEVTLFAQKVRNNEKRWKHVENALKELNLESILSSIRKGVALPPPPPMTSKDTNLLHEKEEAIRYGVWKLLQSVKEKLQRELNIKETLQKEKRETVHVLEGKRRNSDRGASQASKKNLNRLKSISKIS